MGKGYTRLFNFRIGDRVSGESAHWTHESRRRILRPAIVCFGVASPLRHAPRRIIMLAL